MSDAILSIYNGAALTFSIAIGRHFGLLDALAEGLSAADLGERCGVGERYVEQWLGAMVCGGLVESDPDQGRYNLTAESCRYLLSNSPHCLSSQSVLIARYGAVLDDVLNAIRRNGGLPYSAYGAEFHDILSEIWRPVYEQHLVPSFLGCEPAVLAKLADGCNVLELGCGQGSALRLLAERFPRSRFTGIDLSASAIETARATASGLNNLAFDVRDATAGFRERADVILAFDTVHDLPDPSGTLRNIASSLQDDGYFIMVEFNFSSDAIKNVGNPLAILYYAFSIMHCVPVSLGQGGPGLGAVWGTENATAMLKTAGFSDVTCHPTPRPQNCVFICRL